MLDRLFSPMLVGTPGKALFMERITADKGGWVFEVKWDGYRCLAQVWDGVARLRSRGGKDVTHCYPEIAYSMAGLPDGVYDGEIIVCDDAGCPNFKGLQTHVRPASFVAFDLPMLPGDVVTRHDRLETIYAASGIGGGFVPPQFYDFDAAWDFVVAQGLEGVVAKRINSAYEPGERSRDWMKLKQPNWRQHQPVL
jgi:bifunctional non-homologous end joining protein LigD